VRLKDVLWPGLSDRGNEVPVTPKPAPVTLACDMVRLDPPELVMVSGRVWVLPTCTLPNARLDGVGSSCPAVTPRPETGTVIVAVVVLARRLCL